MSDKFVWNPSLHQLVCTRQGKGIIEDIRAVIPNDIDDDKTFLRFDVRLIEGIHKGQKRTFGTAEVGPALIEVSTQSHIVS